MSAKRTRIGLVLGGGGPVGHAFHAGVLDAFEKVSGWDARTAETIVGTSAGAQVAALLRAELSPGDLTARIMGQPLTSRGAAIVPHYVRPRHRPDPRHPLRLLPSAPAYALGVIRHPRRFCLGLFIASVLPEGRVCLDAQAEGFRRLFAREWPERKLWIPTACIDTGERVVFGRAGAPVADVGSAVTASGAIPFVCTPVRVGSHRYVDGCLIDSIHVDVLGQSGLDAAVVSSPLSRFGVLCRHVRRQVQRLRASGLPVLLVEPGRQTGAAMGWNPLDETKMPAVLQSAFRTTVAFLEHAGQADFRRRLEEARQ